MFGLEKYIKDYGDGPKKIIKMGRSNLIIGIIALIFTLGIGIALSILCRQLEPLYIFVPFSIINILIIRNNIKKIKEGKNRLLDDNSIYEADKFLKDFLSNDIKRGVLLDYLNAALIEYFTIKPILVENRILDNKIRGVIDNNINISVFHDWIDIVWFIDIFELEDDTYNKFKAIEDYRLEGKNIPVRELREMINMSRFTNTVCY
ncbi:hypothetical protein [Vallitalea guaymasensis]|uniref:Uncharacterized protein n=1 Tax=Vallitalea guaymasensis TaxID=1185412 RepID=A0A8J8M7Z0_9FIRM|nr:hypothetical protein [Vallitalea guaymasensis]QUH27795.1 hypothetical protein HYG85_02235 [Vallitalea guaymasensis]